MSELQSLAKKIEALNAEIKKKFKGALKEEAKTLFDKHPKLKSFSFTGYTPYFNDGEPCEYSINPDEPGFKYGKFEKEQNDYIPTEIREDADEEDTERYKLAVETFGSMEKFNEFESELVDFICGLTPFEKTLSSVVGEGLYTVTRKGIDVEDYDHD